MTIGGSIALIILGAILAFALTAEIAGIELSLVGIILMVGGVVGLIFGLTMRRRRTTGSIDDPPL